MSRRFIAAFGIVVGSLYLLCAFADQPVYCPQNQGFINVGMTQAQILAACGEPQTKQQSNTAAMQKVAVQQLIYNNQGSPTVFPGAWKLPIGTTYGAQLEIDIANQQVSAILINGSNSNAASLCGGAIQIGDPVSKVYNSCGNPSVVNHTFINQPISSSQPPEIWVYQIDQYHQPISLTFVNGKLQSIN